MSSTNILGLLGGLALFLYGMQMMSNGLESVAGNKMKDILEKLTSNRFLGIIVGALITAVIQSSSATTVMVVGFVNSGMMTLNQAVWIIMGANIGTTITGQLIALDVGALAPLIAFIGVALVVFSKNEKVQFVGEIVAGLGILFVGMNMMGDSMVPLREYPPFINLMTRFSNPLIGIIAGMIFTAVIQSYLSIDRNREKCEESNDHSSKLQYYRNSHFYNFMFSDTFDKLCGRIQWKQYYKTDCQYAYII